MESASIASDAMLDPRLGAEPGRNRDPGLTRPDELAGGRLRHPAPAGSAA